MRGLRGGYERLDGVNDFFETSVVIAEVHFHLLDSGFAFVIGVGLSVQQDGNHLVGESVLGEAADAHIPFAEFGVKLEQALRETVENQVGEIDEVGPVVVAKLEVERIGVDLFAECLGSSHDLVTSHDLLSHHQLFLREGLLVASQLVVGAN